MLYQNFESMKIKIILLPVLMGIVFNSCCLYKDPDIIPPEAEITEIYNITDTSASFTIVVTSESNSQWDSGFEIWLDTLSVEESSPPISGSSIGPDAIVGLYNVTISELSSDTHYFARIHYSGVFDIGGPNELEHYFIGEQKEFITLP